MARPTSYLKKNPDKFRAAMRLAARTRLSGGTWLMAARDSGIPLNTLIFWTKTPQSRSAMQFFAIMEEERVKAQMSPEGESLVDPVEVVSIKKFETPEKMAEHYSLHATKVQVECMLDPKTAKKDRLDAAKRIQDLAGHSPVSKSIVVSAPLDDPRVAKSILSVLEEVKFLQANPPAKLIEGEVLGE